MPPLDTTGDLLPASGNVHSAAAQHPLRLSLAAPVFAAPGHPGLRTPSMRTASWPVVREAVQQAEVLGYDSVWFSDHLFHGRHGAFHESWTALSMAAGFTNSITLVNNHLGNGIRDARLLAKMATTLADATGDRFELFLATGYREREPRSYGYDWEDSATRIRRLSEALHVIRSMWSGEATDFDGEFYHLSEAIATPTGSRAPFVWAGGPLAEEMLTLIAAEADGWNTFPVSVGAYREAAARVDSACRDIGRDPGTLRRSLETQVLVLEHEDEWPKWVMRWAQLREEAPLGAATSDLVPARSPVEDCLASLQEQFIIGTPDQISDRIAAYRSEGVTDFVCWFMDMPSHRSMTELIRIVRER